MIADAEKPAEINDGDPHASAGVRQHVDHSAEILAVRALDALAQDGHDRHRHRLDLRVDHAARRGFGHHGRRRQLRRRLLVDRSGAGGAASVCSLPRHTCRAAAPWPYPAGAPRRSCRRCCSAPAAARPGASAPLDSGGGSGAGAGGWPRMPAQPCSISSSPAAASDRRLVRIGAVRTGARRVGARRIGATRLTASAPRSPAPGGRTSCCRRPCSAAAAAAVHPRRCARDRARRSGRRHPRSTSDARWRSRSCP